VERAVDVRAQRGVTCEGAEDGASRAAYVESKAPGGVGTFCSFGINRSSGVVRVELTV
jgi:hypothetical protein